MKKQVSGGLKLKKNYYSHFVMGIFVFFGAFLSSGLIAGSLTPVSDTSAATNTTTSGDYYVTVSSSDIVNLSVDGTPTGQLVASSDTINVVTNAPEGYKLYISSTNNKLTSTNTSITSSFPTTTGTKASPTTLSPDTWGFSLNTSISTPIPDTTANYWIAMPQVTNPEDKDEEGIISAGAIEIASSTTPTTEAGDNTNIYYGINATTNMPSGTYTTTVTYTAFAEGIAQKLSDVVAVGDYVYMVPSYVGSYTPTTDSSSPYYTGTSTPGSVTPSELRRWIVIKKDNSEIEMVSESISSTNITFRGKVGYQNYIGALNEIAKQYENSKNTVSSRYIGYKSQILQCTSYKSDCWDLIVNNSSYNCSNNDDCQSVYDAIKIARGDSIDPLIGYKVNTSTYLPTTTATTYWLGSRTRSSTIGAYTYYYHGVPIQTEGSASLIKSIYNGRLVDSYDSDIQWSYGIRPIVVVSSSSSVENDGDGSAGNPWVLTN